MHSNAIKWRMRMLMLNERDTQRKRVRPTDSHLTRSHSRSFMDSPKIPDKLFIDKEREREIETSQP